jgi:hypothetical protein
MIVGRRHFGAFRFLLVALAMLRHFFSGLVPEGRPYFGRRSRVREAMWSLGACPRT